MPARDGGSSTLAGDDGTAPWLKWGNLGEDDFQRIFGMKRSEFDALPQWRQFRMRKEHGLF
jgi:hypothetical protein